MLVHFNNVDVGVKAAVSGLSLYCSFHAKCLLPLIELESNTLLYKLTVLSSSFWLT